MNLTDKSIMTFGMHKGKELQDVPATWLMWYYNQITDKINKGTKLNKVETDFKEYIEDNMEVLKKELNERR